MPFYLGRSDRDSEMQEYVKGGEKVTKVWSELKWLKLQEDINHGFTQMGIDKYRLNTDEKQKLEIRIKTVSRQVTKSAEKKKKWLKCEVN